MENFSLYTDGVAILLMIVFVTAVGFAWEFRAALWQIIMSRRATITPAPIGGTNRSIDQSAPGGLNGQTSASASGGLNVPAVEPPRAAPDMDAPNGGMDWEMPRMRLYPTRAEVITWMAAIKQKDGKPVFSANKIVAAVGGDRTEVLAIIRQVRGGTPVYRELDENGRPAALAGVER